MKRDQDALALDLPPQLLNQPMYLMLQLVRHGYRYAIASGNLTPTNLRMPHYATLAMLQTFGPASQKEVSLRLRFDQSDFVKLVDKLEAMRLVARKRDQNDRRRLIISITPQGQKALATREEQSAAGNELFYAPLSKKEREALTEMLRRLLAHHQAAAKEHEGDEPKPLRSPFKRRRK